jgi:hypothetical protein
VVLSTAENSGVGKWQVESGYFGSFSPAAFTTALSSSSVHYLLIPIIIFEPGGDDEVRDISYS